MSSLERPQSTRSSLARKTWANSSVVQVSLPSIGLTLLENLQVIDMSALYLFGVRGRASMKSSVSVKKGAGGEWSSYKESQGLCLLVGKVKYWGQ